MTRFTVIEGYQIPATNRKGEHRQQPELENGFQMHNTIHEDGQQMKLPGSIGEAFNIDSWSFDLCTLLQDRMQCQGGFAGAAEETCQLRPQKLCDDRALAELQIRELLHLNLCGLLGLELLTKLLCHFLLLRNHAPSHLELLTKLSSVPLELHAGMIAL